MKVCKCVRCGVVHEAASRTILLNLDEETRYRITHCRLCGSPSSTFSPLPDEADLPDDELGYPVAVVPWLPDRAA